VCGARRETAERDCSMAQPTIESRLRRRFILMSRAAGLEGELRAALPDKWEMIAATALDDVGGFEEILQHRFMLLDLDESDAFDPLEVLGELRVDLMLNLPVFCFGGAAATRDAARLARADRFFERDEIVGRVAGFCAQYGWGGG
jgi:hypothetical protein